LDGEWKRGGRAVAVIFNVGCWILDDEWKRGRGRLEAAMFNVECWMMNEGEVETDDV
jgi:hypothetical protein